MDRNELAETLLAGLIELEKAGDLVIIHSAPTALADRLCSGIVERWSSEFLLDPPNEIVMEDGVQASSRRFEEAFGVEHSQALRTVRAFIDSLAANRTPAELAALISHQGPQEIADGAYCCAHLQRGDYYSPAYLDWRRERYEQRRG